MKKRLGVIQTQAETNPLPIRDVWAPPLPVSLPLVVLVKAILLDCLIIRA